MSSTILSGDITYGKTLAEDALLSNKVPLGLQMGGGLQRIQRGYKSHPCELPLIRNIGYIHELPSLNTMLTLRIIL
jgi:hypothetical protein